MKILVTGAAGYLGSVITPKLLSRGHSVRVIDVGYFGMGHLRGYRPQAEIIRDDIRRVIDEPAFAEQLLDGIDCVIHLAAISNDPSAELQPELFIEIGKALAQEKGIHNLDRVVISTPRSKIHAKALVTDRIGVMHVAGKTIHHVGMPWHWGWSGLATGDVVNDLTSWVGDPNVSIYEGKAFVCNVERA